MYRDDVLALAAKWKLGEAAAPVLELLSSTRADAVSEASQKLEPLAADQLSARITSLAGREERRITLWGQRRFGVAVWERLEPRVRNWLVQNHGRNH